MASSMMAADVYGFGISMPSGFDQPVSENVGNANPTFKVTSNEPSKDTVGGLMSGHSNVGHSNPLFWLLIVALLFTGYVGFAFDFDIRRVFGVKLRGGR